MIDRLRFACAVALAKTVTAFVKTFRFGAASVLPGKIASLVQPQLLLLLSQQITQGVILIVGTNGKTTTSLLLSNFFSSQGWRVVHNMTGANLVNGLITALLEHSDLWGIIKADYAILEVDENVLPLILDQCQPQYIIGLNLFRDQLDRYGEVDVISQRWKIAISKLPQETTIILNADDPTLCYLGQQLSQEVVFFGLNEPILYLEEIPHAVDSIYCPSCGYPLQYDGVYLSHLGDFHCPSCGFTKSQLAVNSQEWPQILFGVYNKYNTLAAGILAQRIGIPQETIFNVIKNFRAAFGRSEELSIEGKKVRILLSKNPVGMNETIRAVNQIKNTDQVSTILIVLNDQIPDGTDVSWIWDVDTEKLLNGQEKIIVSGDRVYDMALRLEYSLANLESKIIIKEKLSEAIKTALAETAVESTLYILPTYSAMLEVRELLTGRKIL